MSDQNEAKSKTEEEGKTSGSMPSCCDFEKMPQMMKEFMGGGEKMPGCMEEMMQNMSCCSPANEMEK